MCGRYLASGSRCSRLKTKPSRLLANLVLVVTAPLPLLFCFASAYVPARPHDERFSVAPMMKVTDRHFRSLLRLMTRRATLYTEMVVDGSLVFNEGPTLGKWLDAGGRAPQAGPVVLQLGGSNTCNLAHAVAKAAPWAYDAINLNCGCPSEKVAERSCFGVALMKDAKLVASLCSAMEEAAGDSVPISVKCRTGVVDTEADLQHVRHDDEATFLSLCDFIHTVSTGSGVRRFVVHARKGVLSGLSTVENRKVPPLQHDIVLRVAKEFPDLSFVLNGGVSDLDGVTALLAEHGDVIDGVMCGRALRDKPWSFATLDSRVYGELVNPATSRRQLLHDYSAYAAGEEKLLVKTYMAMQEAGQTSDRSVPATLEIYRKKNRIKILNAVGNLFWGEPNGRRFANFIANARGASKFHPDVSSVEDILAEAMAFIPSEVLDAGPGQTEYSVPEWRLVEEVVAG